MGVYHPCGAMLVEEVVGVGIYTKSGHYRVSLDSPGHGVYDSTGARRMTDTTGEPGFVGRYARDGSWNVTIVDGSQRTGLFAPNGSINIVLLNSFDPSILFANGEQGGWYDPSDLTTLFQDAAGTIPVTADGDPVGLVLDKSGNDINLSQTTAAARPTLMQDGENYYIQPDLTDDALTTTFPATIAGDILIAGTNGTIIEPVNYAASSTFTLGPDTYTGGTTGIMAALGDIVGVVLLDRAFTDVEKTQLIAYYKGKGAKGLLVPGPELNTMTVNTVVGDWTANDGVVTATGAGVPASVSFNLIADSVISGKSYLVEIPAAVSGGTWYVDFGPSTASSQIGAISGGLFRAMMRPPISQSLIRVGRWSGPTLGTIGPISVRELRPQEDW